MTSQKDIGYRPRASVSVVIPHYCNDRSIERALDSILSQTVVPQEIIIVDDHSPDESYNYVRNLIEAFPEGLIKLDRLPKNSGPGSARNRGWDLATQPLIAFLDADDTWDPKKTEIQTEYLQAHPEVALVSGQHIEHSEMVVNDEVEHDSSTKSVTLIQMMLANRIQTCTVMIRSRVPFRFEPGKRYSEDYLLWMQIIANGKRAMVMDRVVAYMFKEPFSGEVGLSSKLWDMEKGQQQTLWHVVKEHPRFIVPYLLMLPFYFAKFIRRVLISNIRSSGQS